MPNPRSGNEWEVHCMCDSHEPLPRRAAWTSTASCADVMHMYGREVSKPGVKQALYIGGVSAVGAHDQGPTTRSTLCPFMLRMPRTRLQPPRGMTAGPGTTKPSPDTRSQRSPQQASPCWPSPGTTNQPRSAWRLWNDTRQRLSRLLPVTAPRALQP